MATPINGPSSKRFESIIPNQVHTVFGWEFKIIDLGVYLKNCYFVQKISKVEWKNRMPKFPSKVKVIYIKVTVIILWAWKGQFLIWKGHFCIVCQKVGAMAPLAPRFLRPCAVYQVTKTMCNKNLSNLLLKFKSIPTGTCKETSI